MAFKLEELGYAYNALEEAIDEETMKIHHDKHHKTYVDNLNKTVEGTNMEGETIEDVENLLKNLDEIPENVRQAVINNGGGHYNHTLFWETMTPGGSKEPVGNLKKAMEEAFESFDDFKEKFEKAGAGRFGSGWVNLVEKDGKVEIVTNPNQNSPVSDGYKVIIGNDVWEHAYYLRYQNKRPEYLKAWWKVVNWDVAEKRYNEGK
ncbi:superoxide dismutase [uncultured Peptoniphilus sp.]|uniref:superoxide dismutase n=1 Tax=uncultured Peptoniphilus sp. TaxID=254354 RepID=UPI0028054761|nr:superoxide dismutase [uncultured Peptoniphilus sp.]